MRAYACFAATCLLALAGCGGRTATVGADRTLSISLTEYRLVPQSARVPAGQLTIVVHNDGVLAHSLSIRLNGQFEGGTSPLWPGQSTEGTLTLTPGHYQMASGILSDEALGMYGTLTVTR